MKPVKSGVVIDKPERIVDVLSKNGRDLRVKDDRPEVFVTGSLRRMADPVPEEDLRRMAQDVGIEWRQDYAQRVIPYYASDERPDRHGDIVAQDWNFDNFAKNPVVPFGHDWSAPPIGNSIGWEVVDRKDDDYTGPALLLHNLFAPADVWPFADSIFRLVSSGFLKSSSVGFYPLEILRVEDPSERSELGLGPWGVIYMRSELVEHSVVTVPANPGAVSLLRQAENLLPHDYFAILELARQGTRAGQNTEKDWSAFKSVLRTNWSQMFKMLPPDHTELDVPVALTYDGLQDAVNEVQRLVRGLGDQLKEVQERVEDVVDMRDREESDDELGSYALFESLTERISKALKGV